MSDRLLIENFEQLVNAPKGIQQIRELILQLAFQGKLVPPDSNDEPAAAYSNTSGLRKRS